MGAIIDPILIALLWGLNEMPHVNIYQKPKPKSQHYQQLNNLRRKKNEFGQLMEGDKEPMKEEKEITILVDKKDPPMIKNDK